MSRGRGAVLTADALAVVSSSAWGFGRCTASVAVHTCDRQRVSHIGMVTLAGRPTKEPRGTCAHVPVTLGTGDVGSAGTLCLGCRALRACSTPFGGLSRSFWRHLVTAVGGGPTKSRDGFGDTCCCRGKEP